MPKNETKPEESLFTNTSTKMKAVMSFWKVNKMSVDIRSVMNLKRWIRSVMS